MEPTAVTATAPAGFAARLREATQAEHAAAEGAPFVAELLAGRLPRTAYADLLAQSYRVYEVLEQAAAVLAGHPQVAPFLHPGLTRLPALRADLAFLAGPGWAAELPALPATERYRARLREVAFDWPAGFVAHHYLRYLGDLSGGQIVRSRVSRAYGLVIDGVRCYVFDALPRAKPFKDAYRAALDAVPWDAAEQARVIAEVSLGFRLNAGLFTDLGARHLAHAAARP